MAFFYQIQLSLAILFKMDLSIYFMNKSKLLSIIVTAGLLAACDTEDDNEINSILINRNDYKVVEFTLEPNQQANISVQDISHLLSESYIIDEGGYQYWESDTQDKDFGNALLSFYYAFPPLSGKQSSGWLGLNDGGSNSKLFYLFFENTAFGVISPPVAGDAESSTMMYTIDIRNKQD